MPPIGPNNASIQPPFSQAQIDAAFGGPGSTLYKLANPGSISVSGFVIQGPQYDTKGNLLVASQTVNATSAFVALFPVGTLVPGP